MHQIGEIDFQSPRSLMLRYDSRLRRTKFATVGDRRFFDNWSLVKVSPHPSDVTTKIRSGEDHRLDLVSYRFYGNPRLWWVIALANGIYDPYSVVAGTELRIPSIDSISSFFL